jgi:hypothetical protein
MSGTRREPPPLRRDELDRCIAKTVGFLCSNPAVFVSEMDIHVLMIRELMTLEALNPMKHLYETGATIGMDKKNSPSSMRYRTMLLHKEYGHNTGKGERSDIAIFDPDDVSKLDDPVNLKAGGRYVTPRFILEFGTEKAAGGVKQLKKHMRDDYSKLVHAKEMGYLIHLHRMYVRTSSGSPKLKKHVMKIKQCRNAIAEVWKETGQKERLNALAFVIRIGAGAHNTKRKLDMFDPATCKWRFDIPQNGAESAVLNTLGTAREFGGQGR